MENKIEMSLQCRDCMQEIPEGESPETWARLNVGVDKKGQLWIWCVRHQQPIECFTLAHRPEFTCDRCGEGTSHLH